MNVFQYIVQKSRRGARIDAPASRDGRRLHIVRCADWYPTQNSDQPPSGLEQGGAGRRQRNPDHSESRAVCIPPAGALDWRALRASRDSGPYALCVIATDSQHLRWHQRSRSAIVEAGRGMGMTDRQLLFRVELPLATGIHHCGRSRRRRDLCGTRNHRCGAGRWRPGEYIFRGLSMVNNQIILVGAYPRRRAGVARRRNAGLGRTPPECDLEKNYVPTHKLWCARLS